MSGLPLDDPPNGGPGLDSGVLPHLDVQETGHPKLATTDLEFRDVRDALWLASKLSPTVLPPAEPQPPRVPDPPPPRQPTPPQSTDEPPPPPASTATPPTEPEPVPPPQDWSVGRPHTVRAAVFDRGASAAPLVWPTTPALPNARLIARAMRPLGRRTLSPWRRVLDEEATAERAAQDRMWVPEFHPESWHEFQLVIVIDTAGAAEVWQQMVRELCDLLRRQGAFRNVRTLLVDGSVTEDNQVLLRAEGPVALVNLLPQRLWHWSHLAPRRVRLRAGAPGTPNSRLRVRTEVGLSIKDETSVPIPVLGLEPEFWSAWARLVAVPDAGWVNATTVFVEPDAVVEETIVEPDPAPIEIPAKERVLRFRTFASVPAFQSAGLLAAVPLSLPTIKHVQQVLLPSADLLAIAEVLLGGLLRKTSLRPDDKDTVGYEFHRGVREELLSSGRRSDTVRVARLIGDYLGPRNPIVRNFRDALTDPENTPEPPSTAETRLYLCVQEAVFRALSGKYAPRASRIRGLLRKPDGPLPPSEDGTGMSTIMQPESVLIRGDRVSPNTGRRLDTDLLLALIRSRSYCRSRVVLLAGQHWSSGMSSSDLEIGLTTNSWRRQGLGSTTSRSIWSQKRVNVPLLEAAKDHLSVGARMEQPTLRRSVVDRPKIGASRECRLPVMAVRSVRLSATRPMTLRLATDVCGLQPGGAPRKSLQRRPRHCNIGDSAVTRGGHVVGPHEAAISRVQRQLASHDRSQLQQRPETFNRTVGGEQTLLRPRSLKMASRLQAGRRVNCNFVK
jgi:hypothetical protein